MFCFFSFPCFAGGIIIYSPVHITEYENFRFEIAPDTKFSIAVSSPCVAVQRVSGIEKSGKFFISGRKRAFIYFDNKCFENTEITISVESDTKEIKKYKIGHRIFEPQDMGC